MVCVIISVIIFICIFVADFLTKSITEPIKTLTDNISQKGESTNKDQVYKELEPFVETIRMQHENILRSAKMRQDFTAAVSHELKTPLTAISGYAELIENHMVSPEQEIKFAGEIRKNSHRLLTQINDIIRLSELDNPQENVEMEPVELFALASECAQDLTINAQKRGIQFTLTGTECMVRGNRELLREVIDNLCENAIRYNNEGGTVRLFVGKDQGKSVMMVEDDGIGIPKSQQKRVFERFYPFQRNWRNRTWPCYCKTHRRDSRSYHSSGK
jgi:two-component system phosphate regulon sensor histidine kinase PhoR